MVYSKIYASLPEKSNRAIDSVNASCNYLGVHSYLMLTITNTHFKFN